MSTYSAFSVTDPTAPMCGTRLDPKSGARRDGASSTTTYCYRESGGARSSTTNLDAIPAGAEIEQVVTQ